MHKELIIWCILAGIIMASLLTIQDIVAKQAYELGFDACLLAKSIKI